jgi:hypothetical protein
LAHDSHKELKLVSIKLPRNKGSEYELLYDVCEQNGNAKCPGFSEKISVVK